MNEIASQTSAAHAGDDVSSVPPAASPAPPASSLTSTLTSLVPGLTEEQWREAQSRLKALQADGEKFVRENPGRAVIYAVGAGFLLGLLFRR
jgi:hypothetical protein